MKLYVHFSLNKMMLIRCLVFLYIFIVASATDNACTTCINSGREFCSNGIGSDAVPGSCLLPGQVCSDRIEGGVVVSLSQCNNIMMGIVICPAAVNVGNGIGCSDCTRYGCYWCESAGTCAAEHWFTRCPSDVWSNDTRCGLSSSSSPAMSGSRVETNFPSTCPPRTGLEERDCCLDGGQRPSGATCCTSVSSTNPPSFRSGYCSGGNLCCGFSTENISCIPPSATCCSFSGKYCESGFKCNENGGCSPVDTDAPSQCRNPPPENFICCGRANPTGSGNRDDMVDFYCPFGTFCYLDTTLNERYVCTTVQCTGKQICGYGYCPRIVPQHGCYGCIERNDQCCGCRLCNTIILSDMLNPAHCSTKCWLKQELLGRATSSASYASTNQNNWICSAAYPCYGEYGSMCGDSCITVYDISSICCSGTVCSRGLSICGTWNNVGKCISVSTGQIIPGLTNTTLLNSTRNLTSSPTSPSTTSTGSTIPLTPTRSTASMMSTIPLTTSIGSMTSIENTIPSTTPTLSMNSAPLQSSNDRVPPIGTIVGGTILGIVLFVITMILYRKMSRKSKSPQTIATIVEIQPDQRTDSPIELPITPAAEIPVVSNPINFGEDNVVL